MAFLLHLHHISSVLHHVWNIDSMYLHKDTFVSHLYGISSVLHHVSHMDSMCLYIDTQLCCMYMVLAQFSIMFQTLTVCVCIEIHS